jgi:hypothetical protein
MEKCYRHEDREATGRCKACKQPICNECKLVTDIGTFCSTACENRLRDFQARVSPDLPPPRRKIGLGRMIKRAAFIAILVGIFLAVASLHYGGNPVTGLIDDISNLVSLI